MRDTDLKLQSLNQRKKRCTRRANRRRSPAPSPRPGRVAPQFSLLVSVVSLASGFTGARVPTRDDSANAPSRARCGKNSILRSTRANIDASASRRTGEFAGVSPGGPADRPSPRTRSRTRPDIPESRRRERSFLAGRIVSRGSRPGWTEVRREESAAISDRVHVRRTRGARGVSRAS